MKQLTADEMREALVIWTTDVTPAQTRRNIIGLFEAVIIRAEAAEAERDAALAEVDRAKAELIAVRRDTLVYFDELQERHKAENAALRAQMARDNEAAIAVSRTLQAQIVDRDAEIVLLRAQLKLREREIAERDENISRLRKSVIESKAELKRAKKN